MTRLSKILFVFAGLSFLIMAAVYFMIGVWMPILDFFLIFSIACIAISIFKDRRLYIEFFTLRTTKHGMNMGVLLLLVVAGLICVNYLAVRYNKTFDLTQEKIHSLSEQSRRLISGLTEDVQIKVFYKGVAAQTEKQQIQKVLDLYKEYSSKVKVRYYDGYTDLAEAQDYLNSLSDKDSAKVFAFVEHQGKRIRVATPFDENQFTGAMVKATRRADKKIYFLKGHGERDILSEDPDGLKNFREALEGQAFKVEALNLLEKGEIPKDAEFLAIIGPKSAYLEPEMQKIREFAILGGRLMIAVDPGLRHNLAGFIKSLGVEFENNYVISLNRGGYTPMAVALIFAPQEKITRDFQSGNQNVYAVFDTASELRVAPDISPTLKATELVKSSPYSLAVNDLKKPVTDKEAAHAQPLTMAIQVTGKYGIDPKAPVHDTNKPDPNDHSGEFQAVVYGDSDFISNQSIFLGINRDLGLNTASDLAHESDLIGMRAKSFKGTVLDIGRYQQLGIILGGIGLPLFFLCLSGVMWFRRRGA